MLVSMTLARETAGKEMSFMENSRAKRAKFFLANSILCAAILVGSGCAVAHGASERQQPSTELFIGEFVSTFDGSDRIAFYASPAGVRFDSEDIGGDMEMCSIRTYAICLYSDDLKIVFIVPFGPLKEGQNWVTKGNEFTVSSSIGGVSVIDIKSDTASLPTLRLIYANESIEAFAFGELCKQPEHDGCMIVRQTFVWTGKDPFAQAIKNAQNAQVR